MSSGTLCERRTTCALNDGGVCTLKEPRLDYRSAYVSCLDQIRPIGVGVTPISELPVGGV